MDKLVERESAPRNPLVAAPALAVQFFLIPLAVVAVIGVVYLGFRSMLADNARPARISGRSAERRHRPPLAGGVRAVAPDGRSGRSAPTARSHRRSSTRSNRPKTTIPVFAGISRWPSAGSTLRSPPKRSTRSAGRSTNRTGSPESRTGFPASPAGPTAISAKCASARSGRSAPPAIPASPRGCNRFIESPDAGSARWWCTRSARCRATRSSRRCARRCRMPRPMCAGTPRSRSRATAIVQGAGVIRQMLDRRLRRADRQARGTAGRRPGSDGGRDDQRLCALRRHSRTTRCANRSGLSQQDRSMKVRQAAIRGTEGDRVRAESDFDRSRSHSGVTTTSRRRAVPPHRRRHRRRPRRVHRRAAAARRGRCPDLAGRTTTSGRCHRAAPRRRARPPRRHPAPRGAARGRLTTRPRCSRAARGSGSPGALFRPRRRPRWRRPAASCFPTS